MTRDEALAVLITHRDELVRRGVVHAGLFGSTARGEAGPTSDVDVLVELADDALVGVYEFVALKRYVAALFEGPVDVVEADGLAASVRSRALGDLVNAF